MDFQRHDKFGNEHPVCAVATVKSDQALNRMFGIWFADTCGFYFSANKAKAVFRQHSDNPEIASTLFTPPKSPFGPVKLGVTPIRKDRPPPLLGQHEPGVLADLLGVDRLALVQLQARKVI
ncbi:MAG: hypothetical protein ACXVIL_06215 [Halobacteriota archaeon]